MSYSITKDMNDILSSARDKLVLSEDRDSYETRSNIDRFDNSKLLDEIKDLHIEVYLEN